MLPGFRAGRDFVLGGTVFVLGGGEGVAGDLGILSLLLPPPGAYRCCPGLTQGVASLRSLALGWELIAPSGRADVAGGDREICVGRFSGDVGGAVFVLGGAGICVGRDGRWRRGIWGWICVFHGRCGRDGICVGRGGGGGGGFGDSVAAFAPSGGVSERILPNPGCRFASLACPGLGAHCPSGARGRCRRGQGDLRWAFFGRCGRGGRLCWAGREFVLGARTLRAGTGRFALGVFRAMWAGRKVALGGTVFCVGRADVAGGGWGGEDRRSNKTPEGLQAHSPGQASEAMRHPGFGGGEYDAPPEGAKAAAEGVLPWLLSASGTLC